MAKVNFEQRNSRIIAAWATGKSYSEVSEQFGISRQRVQQIVRPPAAIYRVVKNRAKGKCQQCGIQTVGRVFTESENFSDLAKLKYFCPTCHRNCYLKLSA